MHACVDLHGCANPPTDSVYLSKLSNAILATFTRLKLQPTALLYLDIKTKITILY